MRKVSVASFLVLAFAAVNAQAAAVTLINDGFEASWTGTTLVGSDGNWTFNYGTTGPNVGWTFGAGTGVATSNFLAAQEGSQYAFLQTATGFLSQTFNVSQAGNADLSFFYGLRPNYAAGQALEVYLNGDLLTTLSTQTGWTNGNLSLGFLNAGNNTIAFKGTGGLGGDTTVFLDRVAVNITNVPEPTSALMLSLGLGGLLLARRRNSNV
ncbi:PEP-CTERM sorting domain-containing protein [Methylophilus sp.]|uniref:PEP-CTERM sorting domain-containing protein n=1 Tax=Methylophilus sp. TaxID=29541 RepID=UPI00403664B8